MKERFENDGRPQLVDALKRQETVAGNLKVAEAFIKRGEFRLVMFGITNETCLSASRPLNGNFHYPKISIAEVFAHQQPTNFRDCELDAAHSAGVSPPASPEESSSLCSVNS